MPTPHDRHDNQPRRALLLTGASRGIGHATVKRFSAAGWRVMTCSRHAFPENCPREMGPEDHIQLDLADEASTLKAIDGGFHVERQYAPLADGKTSAASTSFKAGDLVRVTLAFDLPKERRFVAVTDPVPAGFEPVESWFATTASDLAKETDQQDGTSQPSWQDVWKRGTFDHVERHDDRVLLFATRLSEGHHEFSYVVRATTAGTFVTAPARVEEMYEPEVLGRTGTQTIEVTR